jgi:hypothetical protein
VKTPVLIALSALAAAWIIGCTDRPVGSHAETRADATLTRNRAHDMLAKLEPSLQAYSLGRITNEGCVGTRAFYMGMAKDRSAYWSVACRDGKSYQVEIKADATGSTSVMDCSLLKAVAKVNCFQRFEDQ